MKRSTLITPSVNNNKTENDTQIKLQKSTLSFLSLSHSLPRSRRHLRACVSYTRFLSNEPTCGGRKKKRVIAIEPCLVASKRVSNGTETEIGWRAQNMRILTIWRSCPMNSIWFPSLLKWLIAIMIRHYSQLPSTKATRFDLTPFIWVVFHQFVAELRKSNISIGDMAVIHSFFRPSCHSRQTDRVIRNSQRHI